MFSHADHQALADLIPGKSTDYRDTYDTNLLQGALRGPSRDPLGLEADNLLFHGTDIWTLYEFSRLDVKGLPQAIISHAELNYTSVNLIESKSSKLYLNGFSQTRFNNWNEARQTLERDLSTCTQGKIGVALYRLDELEGQPIGHFNGTCIGDQDITIDNYEFTTDHLENAISGEKVAEETLISHLLKSDCLTTHQSDWDSIQTQYRGRQTDREELLHYLVSLRHYNEFHEQRVERILNDLLRLCQSEKLSVYTRYTRRDGLDINPWRSNNDFVPSTTRLV